MAIKRFLTTDDLLTNLWTIDLTLEKELEMYAPYKMNVTAPDSLYNSGGASFVIEVNGSPYTLGNSIAKTDLIKFSTDGAVSVNVTVTKE